MYKRFATNEHWQPRLIDIPGSVFPILLTTCPVERCIENASHSGIVIQSSSFLPPLSSFCTSFYWLHECLHVLGDNINLVFCSKITPIFGTSKDIHIRGRIHVEGHECNVFCMSCKMWHCKTRIVQMRKDLDKERWMIWVWKPSIGRSPYGYSNTIGSWVAQRIREVQVDVVFCEFAREDPIGLFSNHKASDVVE